jgi:telomerase protein component 1
MLPKHEIVDPKTKLLNVCCASLVGRPQYYSSTDDTRGKLVAAADAVCEQDPEFLLKTALYVRDDLNIRSTANFLLALAASKPEARNYLRKYFAKAVRLPTDLTEVVELYQSLAVEEGEDRVPMPTCLRKAVKQKLGGFSLHTIGKYQNKAGKKPKAVQAKGAARGRSGRQGYRQRVCAPLGGMQLDHDQEAEVLKTKRVSVDLKQLVRLTHTSEPKQMVMSLLGKRYPTDEMEFAKSGLTGDFDASLCGKRMKIPVPTT